jgi:large subunit ribosomal protein L23
MKSHDVIKSPAITEKATMVSANNQVRKGKFKRFRGRKSIQGDVKKAIVTLAEGQTIDVMTGL